MAISKNEIVAELISEGKKVFGNQWDQIETYVKVEFKKIGDQIKDILKNVAEYKKDKSKGYSKETGKILLKMQRTSTEAVLVSATILTLVAVQAALDAVFKALKKAFATALTGLL